MFQINLFIHYFSHNYNNNKQLLSISLSLSVFGLFQQEVVPITYALDNGPVGVTIKGNDTIEAIQPVERETGLQKSIEVTLRIDGTVEVKHRIKNTNPESRELSPWTLSYPMLFIKSILSLSLHQINVV